MFLKMEAVSAGFLYSISTPSQAELQKETENMDQLISADDAATVLNISSSTLAKMRLSGKSPRYIKLGRRVAYRPSDLEAWIEAQSFSSTSEYGCKGEA